MLAQRSWIQAQCDPSLVHTQAREFQALWRAQAPAGMGIFLCWKHPELLFLPMVLFSEKKRRVGGGAFHAQ